MPQINKRLVEPDIRVLEIVGRITLGRECQEVEWAAKALLKDGVKKLVFDLSGLDFVDSTGVGILVMCCATMREAGGELRLAAIQPQVAKLLTMARLNEIMKFYPSAAEATQSFPDQPVAPTNPA